jgi:hypothetical protein
MDEKRFRILEFETITCEMSLRHWAKLSGVDMYRGYLECFREPGERPSAGTSDVKGHMRVWETQSTALT